METLTSTSRQALERMPTTFTYSQARSLGISDWTLSKLRDLNEIESLGRGLYKRTDSGSEDPFLLAAATRSPRATLCLRTALARHDLTDDIPTQLDIALPRGTRIPALDGPYSWHHFAAETFNLGREEIKLDGGLALGLYSAERSILDAFRLRGLEGPELANEALRRWLRRPNSHPQKLLELARHLPRSQPSLLRSLQILL